MDRAPQVFVNKPYSDGLALHMHPFTLWIVGIFFAAVRDVWYFSVCEELTRAQRRLGWFFVGLLGVMTVHKAPAPQSRTKRRKRHAEVLVQVNAMLPRGSRLWVSDSAGAMAMGRVTDPLWTLCATVVPAGVVWFVALPAGDRVVVSCRYKTVVPPGWQRVGTYKTVVPTAQVKHRGVGGVHVDGENFNWHLDAVATLRGSRFFCFTFMVLTLPDFAVLS